MRTSAPTTRSVPFPLPIILGIFLVTVGAVMLACLPACCSSTSAPQAKLLIPARNRLVAPVEPQALAVGKESLPTAHIPDAGKMAPERVYAVFDGILCEMVRGQWRPKPPGTPWGTHTVCICTDSGGNVTVQDFIRRAE